jgi:hypothetical protein
MYDGMATAAVIPLTLQGLVGQFRGRSRGSAALSSFSPVARCGACHLAPAVAALGRRASPRKASGPRPDELSSRRMWLAFLMLPSRDAGEPLRRKSRRRIRLAVGATRERGSRAIGRRIVAQPFRNVRSVASHQRVHTARSCWRPGRCGHAGWIGDNVEKDRTGRG